MSASAAQKCRRTAHPVERTELLCFTVALMAAERWERAGKPLGEKDVREMVNTLERGGDAVLPH